jgi:hypothetical protein
MKAFTAIAALVALLPSAMAITIDTPSESALIACQPILLTWRDGVAPYFVTIVAPGPGQLYKQFDQTDATSLTWNVDLPVGTLVNAGIKDSTGAQQYSATVKIGEGKDTSCLNAASGASSDGASATGSPSTTAGAGSSASSVASSAAASASSKASSVASSASSKASSAGASASASASAGNDNAALASTVSKVGVAAVMGLVGAALF